MCATLAVVGGWGTVEATSEGWCLVSSGTEGRQTLQKWCSVEVKFVLWSQTAWFES